MLQCEIDAGGDQGGRDDEADDLRLEAVLAVWVVVHDDATDVTDELAKAAETESNLSMVNSLPSMFSVRTHHECPRFVPYTLHNVDDHADTEEGCEEGIGTETGIVAVE